MPAYISARGPEPDTLLIDVVHPQPGVWHVSSAPGTPAVTKAEIATVLPPPSFRVRLHRRHDGREALSYRIGGLAGAKVLFNARGKDSGQLIGTAHGATGTIVFRPASALGRLRKIEADVTALNGQPLEHPIVATFRAPALPRPGRAAKVRIVRHGSTQ